MSHKYASPVCSLNTHITNIHVQILMRSARESLWSAAVYNAFHGEINRSASDNKIRELNQSRWSRGTSVQIEPDLKGHHFDKLCTAGVESVAERRNWARGIFDHDGDTASKARTENSRAWFALERRPEQWESIKSRGFVYSRIIHLRVTDKYPRFENHYTWMSWFRRLLHLSELQLSFWGFYQVRSIWFVRFFF